MTSPARRRRWRARLQGLRERRLWLSWLPDRLLASWQLKGDAVAGAAFKNGTGEFLHRERLDRTKSPTFPELMAVRRGPGGARPTRDIHGRQEYGSPPGTSARFWPWRRSSLPLSPWLRSAPVVADAGTVLVRPAEASPTPRPAPMMESAAPAPQPRSAVEAAIFASMEDPRAELRDVVVRRDAPQIARGEKRTSRIRCSGASSGSASRRCSRPTTEPGTSGISPRSAGGSRFPDPSAAGEAIGRPRESTTPALVAPSTQQPQEIDRAPHVRGVGR